MVSQIPKHFKLIYSKDEIDRRVKDLGEQISQWAGDVWESSHTDITAVPVLRGGIFFFADLVRCIEWSIETVPVKTWGYVEAENAEQLGEVRVELSGVPSAGRSILLVDDICDSGKTLAALKKAFLDAGAREVRSAVLIKREIEDPIFDPDYVAFHYTGMEWFVGYGMEDSNRWRNLPSVYIIRQPEEQP